MVTIQEMRYLLDMTTVATKRKFDNTECSLWHDLLRDYSYDACYEAFRSVLLNSTEFIQPSLIINEIKRKRKERVNKLVDAQTPPNGLTAEEYRAWLKEVVDNAAKPPTAPPAPIAAPHNRTLPSIAS